jgi:hypothetical protein
MSIKLTQINRFKNLDNFSYNVRGKPQEYSHENRSTRFRKPKLALEKGELVIHFQNIIERFLGPLFHAILKKLHLSHDTSNPQEVWKALQKLQVVGENEPLPEKRRMREIFASKIALRLQAVRPSNAYEAKADISMQDFQKYVYYLDNDDLANAKKILETTKGLNDHFEKALDTPLTLAIKKESFEMVSYLLQKTVDPNKKTKDGQSPLLLAAKKDLPRRYFIALFNAGAKPQDDKETKAVLDAAGANRSAADRNQKLIDAITAVNQGRPISWPAYVPEASTH